MGTDLFHEIRDLRRAVTDPRLAGANSNGRGSIVAKALVLYYSAYRHIGTLARGCLARRIAEVPPGYAAGVP